MRHNSISMLLVGRNLQRCPELYWWLDNRELRCEYAEFCHDACSRISRIQFDLVISEYQLPDRTAFPLLDVLAGSPATLFFSRALATDFLWLLMLDRGRRCVGPRLFDRATSTVHSTGLGMPSGIHASWNVLRMS
jgi:hypothetical protein